MSNKNFLLINKPSGPTSHDIIDKLRKITGVRKIGHAGTLDPFASGLLLVAIGQESTRELGQFVGLGKEYIAILKLGAVSDTYDRTGNIKLTDDSRQPVEKINNILNRFIGKQMQVPPMFSAKKINGKKLYELARKGIEIERKSVEIEIYEIKLISYLLADNYLSFIVSCSSGTYIRALANDIGQALGCGAYLQELARTKIGDYKLENAIELEKIDSENWQDFCFNF